MKVDKKFFYDNNKPFYQNPISYGKESVLYLQIEDLYSFTLYNEEPHIYHEREVYDIKNILDTVNNNKQKLFFKNLAIKTPYMLNHTPSLKRLVNNTDLLKLASFLARSGKKLRSIKVLSRSLFLILLDFRNNFKPSTSLISLHNILYLSTVLGISRLDVKNFLSISNINLYHESNISNNNLVKFEDLLPESLLRTSFKKFNFLFSFYIYKVDKNIYKNSRGRSGKFTFV